MKKLGLGLAFLALAGCSHPGTHEHTFTRGIVPVVDTDEQARSICSATSYESDRNQFLVSTGHMRDALAAYTGVPFSGEEAQSRRSPALYDGNGREVDRAIFLVSQFEAELDGSYDAVVQSCRAYNQCMIRNNYAEGDCSQSASMWNNSQVRFHNLADRMAEIRLEVAQSCNDCFATRPYRGAHHGGHRDGHHGDRHSGRNYGQVTGGSGTGIDSYYGPFSAGDGG